MVQLISCFSAQFCRLASPSPSFFAIFISFISEEVTLVKILVEDKTIIFLRFVLIKNQNKRAKSRLVPNKTNKVFSDPS